jgi:hypothetical protein
MTLAILGEVGGCYIIITLVATSLAKLRTWRSTSVALVREAVIPVAFTPTVVIGIAITELALATAIMVGLRPAGYAAASLFIIFGGYRLAVLARTKSLICGCAGVTQIKPAIPAAIAAACVTFLVQACLGCLWALAPGSVGDFKLAAVAAWGAPFIILARGYLVQHRKRTPAAVRPLAD